MERKKRRTAGLLMLVLLVLGVLPARPVRAAEEAARHDQRFVDVQPGDIDIWDNGKGISVAGGGETYTIDYWGNEYVVLVAKYLDTDGKYTVQADIYFYGGIKRAWYSNTADLTTDDGSVYFYVQLQSAAGMFSSDQGRSYCIKLRDGLFLTSNGEWTASPTCYSSASTYNKYGGDIGSPVFASPFYAKKYIVYSSYEYTPTSTTETGFPVNLLPNAPLGAGTTAIPYKTTFRMLTDGATVYNTFYYTSSYMSGADAISASGTIRCDATKLLDGSVTRTVLTAPQLLCQISSYGTAYDIVYTNDDNLCTLLGIEKPSPKYWDVEAQQWKDGTGSSSGGSSSGAFAPVENLSVKMVGDKGLIDGARYNDYYVYGETSSSLDFKLDDVNVDVWGLGNYLSWNYSGKLYDEVGGSGSGSFGNSRDNIRQMRIIARLELVINGESVTAECVLTGGDSGATLSPAAGDFKLPMHYLQQLLRGRYSGLNLKTQLKRVTYEVTPFYYSKADKKYSYGETASVSIDFQSAMDDYNGGDWSGGINDNWTESSGDVLDWIKNIINTVASSVSWIGGVLTQGMGLFTKLGQIPAMMAGIIPFIPEELWTVVSFGILLYFAPAIVRGIRNLIIGGLK